MRFQDLTPRQRELLTFGGWSPGDLPGRVQPGERTVRKLLRRKMLDEREVSWRGMVIKVYDVPSHVHMEWCAWCSRYCKEKP